MSYTGKNVKARTVNYEPQSADPTNPQEGMFHYADGTVRTEGPYIYKNGVWAPVNVDSVILDFLGNGSFEDSTATDWTGYADAAGAIPVDMTGGTATGVTFAASSSSPLSGKYSGLLSKDAANRQGIGYAKLLTIPAGYSSRLLTFTGIYSTDGSYVSNAFIFYAYDVTGSTLVTPTNFQISASSAGTFTCQLLVPASCVSLRVGFHIASTSATAMTMKVDDLALTYQNISAVPTLLTQDYTIFQAQSSMTVRSGFLKFNLGTATITNSGTALIVVTDDGGGARTRFTAASTCIVNYRSLGTFGAAGFLQLRKLDSGSTVIYSYTGDAVASGDAGGTSGSIKLATGEYFSFVAGGGLSNTADEYDITFTAMAV